MAMHNKLETIDTPCPQASLPQSTSTKCVHGELTNSRTDVTSHCSTVSVSSKYFLLLPKSHSVGQSVWLEPSVADKHRRAAPQSWCRLKQYWTLTDGRQPVLSILGAPYDDIRQSFGVVSKKCLYKKYGTAARGAIIA